MSINTTPVIAIPIVDNSASMSYSNYVAITKIDTKAFLGNALPGDYIGLVSYDYNGKVSYNLTQVDQALAVPAAAASVVQNLDFNGGATNMGGGLQTAVSMLAGGPTNLNVGFVLLSDGYQNYGTPPIPLPAGTPAVYSCAMGPASDQTTMQKIGTQSNGKYYYAPYVFDMMQIYNSIRSQKPNTQLLVNGYKNATPFDSLLIPATVSSANDLGQFSVVWSDPSYQYTNGIPGMNQISVTLVTPQGITINPTPSIQGGGYVVFNIENPQAGLWYIQIMYGGSQPIGLTGGAFEYSPSLNAPPIMMDVIHPEKIKAGAPLDFSVQLTDDGHPITEQQIIATITRPKLSVQNALQTYSHLLKDVILPENIADVTDSPEMQKLKLLYQHSLPHNDLLPHISQNLFPQGSPSGLYTSSHLQTDQAGSYNLKIDVTGYSSKSGSPFSRSFLSSILVED